MGNVNVSIEGTERFKAKLQRMRSVLKDDAAKEIGMAGSQVIVRHAQDIVHVISGDLRDSIRAEETDEPGVAQAVAGGDGVDYAGIEEFRPGHAYMRPAVDMSKSEVRTVMRRRSYSLIKKATS